ncbi:MAG: LysM peptidoglycan-binding domain-containing protein [bacterium]|nr:LysM peptidoglycan-binding domain-containing protein [bacterium]
MQKAILLIDYLNVSQKALNNFSHQGDKAIDISFKDQGISNLKAPFTGTIKRIYDKVNVVWLQSNEKVMYADGTIDYMTIMTMHDNDVRDLYVGKIIKQGEVYYQEGTKGNATGNHIHLSVGKGKFTGNGWYENSSGNWCINNQYDVHKALFLDNSTTILNSGGYNWIRSSTQNEDTTNTTTYKVVKNDNLTNIAKKYSTTVDELVRLNNIQNKNLIKVGQALKVPNKLNYFKKYTGNSLSIVDALKSIGELSTYDYRGKIASINGINNYKGTSTENTKLLNLLKNGSLIKP